MTPVKHHILIVMGTRPEAIKLFSITQFLQNHSNYELTLCSTGQHKELMEDCLDDLGLSPDIKLTVMLPGQSLNELSSKLIQGISTVIKDKKPDLVLVQGDTNSAFCGALAAFYAQVPVAHVEAGLRTHNKYSPYPEEVNRQMISRIAQLHFCPTEANAENLVKENITDQVFVTGNTGLDATAMILKSVDIPSSESGILYTIHRRENIAHLDKLTDTIIELAQRFPDKKHHFITHPNPRVKAIVTQKLSDIASINLLDPLPYSQMIALLRNTELVVTDSGGLVEECSFIGKPVVILRDTTERQESISAGQALLCSPTSDNLTNQISDLLRDTERMAALAKPATTFGDGNSAERIENHISNFLYSDNPNV